MTSRPRLLLGVFAGALVVAATGCHLIFPFDRPSSGPSTDAGFAEGGAWADARTDRGPAPEAGWPEAGPPDASPTDAPVGVADTVWLDTLAHDAGAGQVLWAKAFGAKASDFGEDVALDSQGNVLVIGTYEAGPYVGCKNLPQNGWSAIFIGKYGSDGSCVWAKGFGAQFQLAYGRSVAVDSSNNVYAAGSFMGDVDFSDGDDPASGLRTSSGNSDIVVASYDAGGAYRWVRSVGGTGVDQARGVTVDSAGNVTVTGGFQLTVDFSGTAATGAVHTSTGTGDIFVASYDSNNGGAFRWVKALAVSSSNSGSGTDVATDGAGNVVVTGSFSGTVDFSDGQDPGAGLYTSNGGSSDIFVASYDANGAFRWAKAFGGPSPDSGLSVATDSSGNVVVVGEFSGTCLDFGGGPVCQAASNYEAFVASFGPMGQHRWSRAVVGPNTERAFGVTVDNIGNAVVTGTFSDGADFGGGQRAAQGSADLFVTGYDGPTGSHLWDQTCGGPEWARGQGVAVASTGEVTVTGTFRGDYYYDSNTLPNFGEEDILLMQLDPTP